MPSTATRTTSAAPITRLRVNFISRSSPPNRNALDERFEAPVYSGETHCAECPEAFPGWCARAVLAAALLVSLCTNVAAHEIPGDVTIQAWLKPEGQRLRLLVRVPLVAMRDMNYPTRGDKTLGILDLSRAESLLRDAATLWVGEAIDVYEGDTRLPLPRLVEVRPSLPSDRSFTSSYDEALAHVTGPRLAGRHGPAVVLGSARRASSSTRFNRTSRPSRWTPARSPRAPDDHGAPAGAARRHRAGVRVRRRPGFRAARSALAPGGVSVREARLHPHPRRHRPPAVPVLPRHSVPAFPRRSSPW